jgi:type VI secretion system secreted protein VgrG
MTNKAGMSLTNEAQLAITNKGQATNNVESGGITTIKGAIVKIN